MNSLLYMPADSPGANLLTTSHSSRSFATLRPRLRYDHAATTVYYTMPWHTCSIQLAILVLGGKIMRDVSELCSMSWSTLRNSATASGVNSGGVFSRCFFASIYSPVKCNEWHDDARGSVTQWAGSAAQSYYYMTCHGDVWWCIPFSD